MAKMNIFDVAKNINKKDGHINLSENLEVDMNVFMVNKIFSKTQDTIFLANEVNRFSMSDNKQMVYDFYYYAAPKSNYRYGSWDKADKTDEKMIEQIMLIYGYTYAKAKDVLPILKPHAKTLDSLTSKGGYIKR